METLTPKQIQKKLDDAEKRFAYLQETEADEFQLLVNQSEIAHWKSQIKQTVEKSKEAKIK